MDAVSARQKIIAVLVSFGMLVALSSPASARATAGVTLTASSRSVAFHGIVTLVASVEPAVAGQDVSILDASGVAIGSGTTASDGTFSLDVRPAANLVAHASSLGVESAPVSVGVRPLVTLTTGAVRLFDDLKVRGTFKPVRQGLRVTVVLQHRGDVVSTKRVAMDANGRFRATFVVPQAGSYRARAVLDAPDLLPGRAASSPSVTPLPDLATGAHGIYVALLERRLVQLHYHLVGVDDVFDDRTADAVMAFRKVQGMARIQTVDAATWRALGAPRTFVPRDRSDGFHIEVDQTRQVLVTVRDGQAENIIHVSTGKPSTPTRDGSFHVFSKLAGYSPKRLYYPSFFDGERAIHGWTDVPTYAASHGCVRIPYWITLWMFAQDPIGTPILIYH
jgi:L,D-transpeptidase catalytic domain/Putative peptidoglycan binding domain